MRHTDVVTEPGAQRVAVYLDFDNIVISRYDQVNGRNSYQRDKTRETDDFAERLAGATVDLGAIIDFASSFGTLVLTRAYADWSAEVNAAYRGQLVARAVDLVQLFPAAAYGKNGADIRLAVDAVEDMFRLPDLTHVVIVGGDSDYIPLVQRCKRLGRVVVGIGVQGSTSQALVERRDEPSLEPVTPAAKPAGKAATDEVATPELTPATAARLLVRAIGLARAKQDDDEWLNASTVKSQIKRLDPSFNEKSLGYRSFSDFLRSHADLVELDETSTTRMVRLR